MTEQRIPVIVLAGGASRRMGTDKRLVHIGGEPMLQRVVDGLAGHPVVVVVDPHRDAIPIGASSGVVLIPDTRPGEGPLAALEAGLTAVTTDMALVVAGDMPWLEPALLELLVDRLAAAPAADLTCLTDDGRPQPLPMACRRIPTLARVTALLDDGERRLRAMLEDPATTTVPETVWRAADPTGRSLMDVDTPADLARAG